MADQEIENQMAAEWTVEGNEEVNGEEVEAQEGPVFVAMQPGVDIPAGVEVQEVVVVTEGSESVQEVAQQQETPQRQELSTLLRDDFVLKQEKGTQKVKVKKRQLEPFVRNDLSQYETPKPVNRGRPKGSKNILYRQPEPRPRPTIPSRTPVRPSLNVKREAPSSSDSSDSDSEEEEDLDAPPKKRPKPREFAHR